MKNYNIPYFGVIQAMTSTLPQGDVTLDARETRKQQRTARINPLRLLGARR
jgi:hypothetical protein